MWNSPFKPNTVLVASRPTQLSGAALQRPAANAPRVLQPSRSPAQAQLSLQFRRL
jgi:hypothetical protein